MHPDSAQLAAYLDGALPEAERAAIRGHVLTCATCAARLERLHTDAGRIQSALAAPLPDIRADVRRRLRQRTPLGRFGKGVALAGTVLAVLLLAVFAGLSGGAFGGRPDRLFVADYAGSALLALDASNGATLATLPLPAKPTRLRYDAGAERLYALVATGVLAIDPRALAIMGRWQSPAPISVNADMVLDATRGRLYVALPQSIAVLNAATLAPLDTLPAGPAPGPLALAAEGRTLLALDTQEATLWTFDLAARTSAARLLAPDDVGRQGWLALANGEAFVLRSGHPPSLWRPFITTPPITLTDGAPPRDLLALPDGRLAIARGDGRVGGIEIIAGDGASLQRIDPGYDQHRLAPGPGDALFAVNWLHGSVTRYGLRRGARVWHIELAGRQPWDAAFVPGGY